MTLRSLDWTELRKGGGGGGGVERGNLDPKAHSMLTIADEISVCLLVSVA